MKYTVRTILSLTAAAFALSSCVKEPVTGGGGEVAAGVPVKISLASGTRIAIADDRFASLDYEVNTLRIIGYDTKKKTLAFNRYVSNSDITGGNPAVPPDDTTPVLWKAQSEILTGDYTIVFIANEGVDQEMSDLLGVDDNINTLAKLQQVSFSHESLKWNGLIPMIGVYDNVAVLGDNDISLPDPEDPAGRKEYTGVWPVTMKRLAVRVDFTMELTTTQAGHWDKGTTVNNNQGAYLLKFEKVPEKMYLFPGVDNSSNVTRKEYEGRFGQTGYNIYPGYCIENADESYTVTYPRIILPESYFTDPSNGNKAVTVSTDFSADGTTVNTVSAKIGNDLSSPDYTLPRDHYFTVNAQVKDFDAELDLTLSVVPWNDKLLDMDINGPYELWVEETDIKHDWLPSYDVPLEIRTDYKGKWYATLSGSETDSEIQPPAWITPNWNDAGFENGATLTYDLDFNFDPSPETAYLHIRAGRFTKVIRISRDDFYYEPTYGDNCYMTDPDTREPVVIKPWDQISRAMDKFGGGVRAGNATGDATLGYDWLLLDKNSKWSVGVLWSDKPLSSPVVSNVEFVGDENKPIYSSDFSISVTPGTTHGNAVIALFEDKNGDGLYDPDNDVIKWSWHIWNTDYRPGDWRGKQPDNVAANGAVQVTKGKVHLHHNGEYRSNVFMDRNLGSTPEILADGSVDFGGPAGDRAKILKTYGLYYQWGRKDPFPGPANNDDAKPADAPIYSTVLNSPAVAKQAHASTNNLTAAINNPLTFYWHTSSNDWFTNNNAYQNHFLWGNGTATTNDHVKSVYDPCPPGWRVPLSSTSNGYSAWNRTGVTNVTAASYTSNTSSYVFTNILGYYFDDQTYQLGYYPAAGYRLIGSGLFTVVTTRGYWWSASQSAANAQSSPYLYIYSGTVSPVSNNNPTNGLSVRCVAE